MPILGVFVVVGPIFGFLLVYVVLSALFGAAVDKMCKININLPKFPRFGFKIPKEKLAKPETTYQKMYYRRYGKMPIE